MYKQITDIQIILVKFFFSCVQKFPKTIIDQVSRTCTANGTPEVHPSHKATADLRGARITTNKQMNSKF